jgi:hypothetical protein
MPRRKQIYKITYPNGKIYVGMDLTGTILYFGSPSAHEQIAADLGIDAYPLELRIRKEILWECETATDAQVREKEKELIRETRANDPAIGYNKLPCLAKKPETRSPTRPRERCPICERFIALDIAGQFVEHGVPALCEGSFSSSSEMRHSEARRRIKPNDEGDHLVGLRGRTGQVSREWFFT